MTDREMHDELAANDIHDNPFDDMLYHGLELTRDLLFACHRHRNKDVLEQFWTTKERLDSMYGHILEVFEKIQCMSDDTVEECRTTSKYYANNSDEFVAMNEGLLEFERNMQTVWTECNPCYDDRFEQLRLGEDSEEYKRLLELREISTDKDKLGALSDSELSSIIDVMYRLEEIKTRGSSHKAWSLYGEELEKTEVYITEYRLTEDDVHYMKAFRKVIKYNK